MIAPRTQSPFSSEVRLNLIVSDRSLSVSKVGPDRLVLQSPESLPPCEADLVMTVDGRERRWTLLLPDGASADSPIVRTLDAEGAAIR